MELLERDRNKKNSLKRVKVQIGFERQFLFFLRSGSSLGLENYNFYSFITFRLNHDKLGGAWCPKETIQQGVKEWIQIQFTQTHVITGIVTQVLTFFLYSILKFTHRYHFFPHNHVCKEKLKTSQIIHSPFLIKKLLLMFFHTISFKLTVTSMYNWMCLNSIQQHYGPLGFQCCRRRNKKGHVQT